MKNKYYSLLAFLVLFLLPSWAFAMSFTPSPSDPSVVYLSYIFGVVNGVLSGSGTQILGKMFNVFNMSVLMLGSIIAVYTTIMAVLNSGQDGEFMGKKWSSLFVPLRVLLGVLLIAPTTTGYSLIQVAVMWIVLQGVGAANYVWSEVINYLTAGGTLFTSNTASSSSSYSQFYNSMMNLSESVFCLETMNLGLQKLTSNITYTSQRPSYLDPPSVTPYYSVMNQLTSNIYTTSSSVPTATSIPMPLFTGVDSGWAFLNGICGQLNYSGGTVQSSGNSSNNADTTQTTYTYMVPLGLQQAMSDIDAAVSPMVNNICAAVCPNGVNCAATSYPYAPTVSASQLSSGCAGPTGFPLSTFASSNVPYYYWYNNPVANTSYSDALSNATNAFIGMISTYNTGGSGLDTNSDWLQAGNYFFQLLSYVGGGQDINGTSFSVVYAANFPGNSGGIPTTAWTGIPATNGNQYTYLALCDNPSSQTQGCTNYPSSNGQANSGVPQTTTQQILEAFLLPLVAQPNISSSPAYVVGNFLTGQSNQGSSAPMTTASNVTAMGSASANLFAGGQELFDEIQDLTNVTNTGSNPILIMMGIGSAMIDVAFNTWLLTTLASLSITLATAFIPCESIASGFLPLTNALLSMVMALVVPLIAAGGMLLYYFPMVPFMIYSFGVVGWLFGVIEGMVAAPIVGIGIMHPDGHEVFGKGEQALMLLLNMFLRPSLMVFGLVVSIMLVYVSVWIVNSGINSVITQITNAAAGSTWANTSTGMGYFAVPIVYVVIIFNVTGKCFTMIYVLPDKVTRWLSGGQQESLGADMGGMVESVKSSTSSGLSAYGGAIGQGGGGHAGAIKQSDITGAGSSSTG